MGFVSSCREEEVPGYALTIEGFAAMEGATPEDRGSLFHVVDITVNESGSFEGGVIQAFAGVGSRSRF
jgi:hypothetical protein